jgi:AcrR family transcriptional regulator
MFGFAFIQILRQGCCATKKRTRRESRMFAKTDRRSKGQQSVGRDLIHAKALKLFRQNGFHGTSMQDIAEEVGILKGSLYHHIENKDQLLSEVLEDYVAQVHDRVREVFKSKLAPRAKLSRIIMVELEVMAAHQDAIVVWSGERGHLGNKLAKLEERTRAVDDMLRSVVRAGVKAGTWSEVNERMACQAILGMLAYFSAWYRPNGELSVQEIGESFASYADRVLIGE